MSTEGETGFAEVNGTRLYYEVAGAGTPLVLIHGFSLDRRLWDLQFSDLARHWRVLRYDLRGFGRSALPAPGQPYRHHDDLAALLAHLRLELAALVGLSLGGLVALNTALEYPAQVSALVLVDTIVSGRPMSAAWDEEYRQARRLTRTAGLAAAKQAWLNVSMLNATRLHPVAGPLAQQQVDDWSGWQFANHDPENTALDARARLAEVRVPALIVVGERDHPDLLAIADELTGLPRSRKVVVPGAGHLVPLEAPAEFYALLTSFLNLKK
jgi:pimeloyl-ACP methyl ester carboxylesterase